MVVTNTELLHLLTLSLFVNYYLRLQVSSFTSESQPHRRCNPMHEGGSQLIRKQRAMASNLLHLHLQYAIGAFTRPEGFELRRDSVPMQRL